MFCHSETTFVLLKTKGQTKNVLQSTHPQQKNRQKLAGIQFEEKY